MFTPYHYRAWQCQDKPNVTNNIVCTSCGGAGHIAKDCAQRRPGADWQEGGAGEQKVKTKDLFYTFE